VPLVRAIAHEAVAGNDRQGAAAAHDAGAGDQPLAGRRRQQVHLELDRHHRGARRHQAQRGVAAGAVDHRGQRARVQEAVLLGEVEAERHLDFALARGDARQLGAQRVHQVLPREARADALCEAGISGSVVAHVALAGLPRIMTPHRRPGNRMPSIAASPCGLADTQSTATTSRKTDVA
jgi:hypothetical protein